MLVDVYRAAVFCYCDIASEVKIRVLNFYFFQTFFSVLVKLFLLIDARELMKSLILVHFVDCSLFLHVLKNVAR